MAPGEPPVLGSLEPVALLFMEDKPLREMISRVAARINMIRGMKIPRLRKRTRLITVASEKDLFLVELKEGREKRLLHHSIDVLEE